MPRKITIVPGVHTFYIPSGYLPLIWDFVINTDIIPDKKLYLIKVLIFIESLYIRLKHKKAKKTEFSIKNAHDLLRMDNSDCSLMLKTLEVKNIIFCYKKGYVTGEIPYSYGLKPLPQQQSGFDRVSVKKKYIRKPTLESLSRRVFKNEELKLYYDEVISKLEVTGINMEALAIPVNYESISGNEDNKNGLEVKNKYPTTISSIHYSGGFVPDDDDKLINLKEDGDFVPKTENTSNKVPESILDYQKMDGGFVPSFPKIVDNTIVNLNPNGNNETGSKNPILQVEEKNKYSTIISPIHYSGDFVPDDFLCITKVSDEKYLPLFRIYDKRFFCRPSYKHPDGRVYTNVTNLKKEFRKYLSIDGKQFIGIDVCNCQPLLAAILFMNYSMKVYGELKEDVIEYKRECESGNEFYEYFMNINKIAINDGNRKVLKGKFFGDCFYSKNASEKKRKELSIQFEEKYPTCYEALVEYKGGFEYSPKYKDVPITLQSIEKSFVFNTNIQLIRDGRKCFNIFDSLFCNSMEDLSIAEQILRYKFMEWNVTPKFKIVGGAECDENEVLAAQILDETGIAIEHKPEPHLEPEEEKTGTFSEPEIKPNWWESLDYFKGAYGEESAKEFYEGQTRFIGKF